MSEQRRTLSGPAVRGGLEEQIDGTRRWTVGVLWLLAVSAATFGVSFFSDLEVTYNGNWNEVVREADPVAAWMLLALALFLAVVAAVVNASLRAKSELIRLAKRAEGLPFSGAISTNTTVEAACLACVV